MQTLVVEEVTDRAPSPFVLTIALNLPPNAPLAGRFAMIGVVGSVGGAVVIAESTSIV